MMSCGSFSLDLNTREFHFTLIVSILLLTWLLRLVLLQAFDIMADVIVFVVESTAAVRLLECLWRVMPFVDVATLDDVDLVAVVITDLLRIQGTCLHKTESY